MKIRNAVCAAGATAALCFAGAGSVHAAGTGLNCSDFSTPVKISHFYDPDHLDADGDGIGCEDNAGDPVVYDRYSQLRDEGDSNPQPSVTPTLAHTGAGDLVHTHPLRSIGAAGLTIGAGVVTVLVVRRRTTKEN